MPLSFLSSVSPHFACLDVQAAIGNWKLFHVLPMLVSVPEQEDPAPEWQVKLLVGQFEKQQPKTSVQRDHSSDICRYHSISATRLNLNQNRGFSLALNEVILQPQQNE